MRADDELDLAERFRELREAEARDAPPFDRVWRERETATRRRRFVLLAAAAMLTAFVLSVVLLTATRSTSDSIEIEPRIATPILRSTTWKGPTDFLLETPGNRTLRTTPSFPSFESMTGTAIAVPAAKGDKT